MSFFKIFLCVVIVSIPLRVHSQILYNKNIDVRTFAIGLQSAIVEGISGLTNNQGALSFLEKNQISTSYFNYYGIKELVNSNLLFGYKLNDNSAAGITYSYLGFENYKEQNIGISYSQKINSNLGIGIKVSQYSTRYSNYTQNTYIPEIGVYYKHNTDFLFGINARYSNPNKLETNSSIGFTPSDKFLFTIGTSTSLSNTVFYGGIEYNVSKIIFLRCGYHGNQMTFGAGIIHKNIYINIASSTHPHLGLSPAISLGYEF